MQAGTQVGLPPQPNTWQTWPFGHLPSAEQGWAPVHRIVAMQTCLSPVTVAQKHSS